MCRTTRAKAWVDETLHKIWEQDLTKILRMFEYGNACGEQVWKTEGYVHWDYLKDFYPRDALPLQVRGQLAGVQLQGKQALLPPRSFWIANEPEHGSLFGRSRMWGVWEPWIEKRGKHGAIDIRRLWYVKNAFHGGKMRHPPGVIEGPDGVLMSCQDYARQIAEKVETGGIMVLPNTTDENGNFLWDYEEPKINGELRDIRDYPKDLLGKPERMFGK